MPLIKCNCLHIKVCEHRGKMEDAWQRVLTVGDSTWGDLGELVDIACPYRTPKSSKEALHSTSTNTESAQSLCVDCGERYNGCVLIYEDGCDKYSRFKWFDKRD